MTTRTMTHHCPRVRLLSFVGSKVRFSSKFPQSLPNTDPVDRYFDNQFHDDSCATPRALPTTTFRLRTAAGPLGLAIVSATCRDDTSTAQDSYARSRASFRRHSIIASRPLLLHVSCRSRPSYSSSSSSSQTRPD